MFSLAGKVAIVTGASKGIGLATSKRFLEAGAQVVMACRSEIAPLAKELGADFIKTDVSKEDSICAMVDKVACLYGNIDILVNNAGIGHIDRPIQHAVKAEYEEAMDVNFMSAVYGIKHVGKHMNSGGSIVNIASLGGVFGSPAYGAYGASKAAMIQITKVAALEYADFGIRVNCICPATVKTEMVAGSAAEVALSKAIWPLRRMAEPDEVAALVHFLAAEDCRFITGQAIYLDGGYSAGIGVAEVEAILG